ncbi:hypothetical protein BD324DRAFT_17148 [Kockovaella imperatae]|uniref:Uncharacterized protein n=1 Tax=Kockovaella imperatae TaxID=4999 RepID=A0A1Y1URP6_9TREE|nr:hypothetical protein BD324DRAFT_17148 [Kockovaella imperatae]ORX40720.1 hypothetical protein BD324DRAFT_17148 [Kockovaella imperatae]
MAAIAGVRARKSLVVADQLLDQALKESPPTARSIEFEASLAAHHIWMDRDIGESLRPVIQTLDQKEIEFGGYAWTQASVTLFENRSSSDTALNDRLADASFRIIEHKLGGQTGEHAAVQALVNVAQRIAATCVLSPEQRMNFIMRAVTLGRSRYERGAWFAYWFPVIRASVARDDDMSLEEAMAIWNETADWAFHLRLNVCVTGLPEDSPRARDFLIAILKVEHGLRGKGLAKDQIWSSEPLLSAIKARGIRLERAGTAGEAVKIGHLVQKPVQKRQPPSQTRRQVTNNLKPYALHEEL